MAAAVGRPVSSDALGSPVMTLVHLWHAKSTCLQHPSQVRVCREGGVSTVPPLRPNTLPTFLIVGAPKAGTTSLWRYLRGHPQVFVPHMKEPSFFVEELRWRRGVEWYRGLFADAGDAVAVGEASVAYSMYPVFAGVPERIASVIPGVQLIYLMRDPIERMRSAYVQHLAEGRASGSIKEEMLAGAQYINSSRYALQVERYLDWFPRSRMLLITSEDLRDHRAETVSRILAFIGVDSDVDLDMSGEYNRGQEKRTSRGLARPIRRLGLRLDQDSLVRRLTSRIASLPILTRPIASQDSTLGQDLRQRLVDVLRPDVERLRRYMEPAFSGWGMLEEEPRLRDIRLPSE